MDKKHLQKSRIFESPKSEGKVDFEEIEKEAKEILEKFARALEKVKDEKELDFYVDREEFERIEGKGCEYPGFKKSLLENAPKKNEDFIIAEKGDWK